jgi:hypothetical protein
VGKPLRGSRSNNADSPFPFLNQLGAKSYKLYWPWPTGSESYLLERTSREVANRATRRATRAIFIAITHAA